MEKDKFDQLIHRLVKLPTETEWVEFKHNNSHTEEIGKNISALANSTAILKKPEGFLIWGIEDGTHRLVGTTFDQDRARHGNQALELWLISQMTPPLNIKWHKGVVDGVPVVLLEIPAANHIPVSFQSRRYIRVGSSTADLKNYPEKERELWMIFDSQTFEKDCAAKDLRAEDILALLDYPAYFEKINQPLPTNQEGLLSRLTDEGMIAERSDGRYDIKNLGAILFARDLTRFERLARKALRVVVYKGKSRAAESTREMKKGSKGYAIGFEEAIDFINDQLPQNEEIGRALRVEERMYPEIAIRELVANSLIHQDFTITGAGPIVEIFADRIEVTNPGEPLIETLRFIDQPARSRNEPLASFMRRIKICEELGSGIDKVISAVEFYQLPPPDFRVSGQNTISILYSHRKFSEMDSTERDRACYQHACLLYVGNARMTNSSLRKRLSIDDKNYPMVSRVINSALKSGLIKPADPKSSSRKHASYLPFWA